ncbi:MAG: hypothetical protein IT305_05905 [Chloroflexi bacterium]|nr:hypothetical protein [Chloroflexota bacterium]
MPDTPRFVPREGPHLDAGLIRSPHSPSAEELGLSSSRPAVAPRRPPDSASSRAAQSPLAPRFDIARMNDNELILFDDRRKESWIVYPPRSRYDFLERPSATTVLVEHHPWAPYADVVVHAVDARTGCREHGLDCGAQAAIETSVQVGWNPFT